MDRDTKDILEVVNFIKGKVEQLPTKEEVRGIVEEVVDEKLQPIHGSLTEISRRLDALEEHYANLKGVTKEIDEIRSEVRAIEKHLGLNKKIAAWGMRKNRFVTDDDIEESLQGDLAILREHLAETDGQADEDRDID